MTLITDHEVRMENAADKRAWWNIRLLAVRSVMTDDMAAYQSLLPLTQLRSRHGQKYIIAFLRTPIVVADKPQTQ